ncbi:DUF1456 family protein [Aerococcaceae bacterium 50-4]
MNNNDRLTRLRYALDINDEDMMTIFEMGGAKITLDQVRAFTTRVEQVGYENTYEEDLDNEHFERFLNGIITSQRGVREGAPEPKLELTDDNANNLLLKKMKIALSLTTEELHEMMEDAGGRLTKSELGAVLRKEGHRNYKPCGDRYARNFLNGLKMRYRGE